MREPIRLRRLLGISKEAVGSFPGYACRFSSPSRHITFFADMAFSRCTTRYFHEAFAITIRSMLDYSVFVIETRRLLLPGLLIYIWHTCRKKKGKAGNIQQFFTRAILESVTASQANNVPESLMPIFASITDAFAFHIVEKHRSHKPPPPAFYDISPSPSFQPLDHWSEVTTNMIF